MFVEEKMTKDVAVVKPEDSVAKAFQVLKERKLSQLPVIDDNGKLVGLITEKLLAEVSPSKATSLSIYEINYLLSKTKVKDIMMTEIFTITPERLIESAAFIMKNEDIGSLPVVDKDNKLVGILTRIDIFAAFIDITGVNEEGTRIVLKVDDAMGVIANIAKMIKDANMNITHISNYTNNNGDIEVIVKLDEKEVSDLLVALEKEGYTILSTT